MLLTPGGGVLTIAQGVTGFDFDFASQVKRAEDCGHNLVNPVTANNKCQFQEHCGGQGLPGPRCLSSETTVSPGVPSARGLASLEGSTARPGHGGEREIKQWLSPSATRLRDRRGREKHSGLRPEKP